MKKVHLFLSIVVVLIIGGFLIDVGFLATGMVMVGVGTMSFIFYPLLIDFMGLNK